MYGTIARLRVKPGAGDRLLAFARELRPAPDQIAEYAFRPDAEPDTLYLVVVFAGEEAYRRNAARPETHADYERLLQFLEGEPAWHDGAIVHAFTRP